MNRYQDFKLKSQLDPPLPDDTIIELEKELSSLKKQNEIMRKALEFYAKEVQKDHWPDGKFKGQFLNVKTFEDVSMDLLHNKSKVVLDGYLGQNEYTNKEGKQISNLEVIANKISPEAGMIDPQNVPQDDEILF